VGGGIAMGAFAGAQRVEHTYPDFVAAGHPMDVLVPLLASRTHPADVLRDE
jgi:hypothetical protein